MTKKRNTSYNPLAVSYIVHNDKMSKQMYISKTVQ